MIIDSQLELSNKQSLAGSGTIVSTNVIDTGSVGDVGIGETLRLYVQIDQALAGATAVQIVLQTDDNEAFSSPVAIYTSQSFAAAAVVAGAELVDVEIPRGAERYLRVGYVLTGTATAGQATAVLVENVQRNRAYQSGFTVA